MIGEKTANPLTRFKKVAKRIDSIIERQRIKGSVFKTAFGINEFIVQKTFTLKRIKSFNAD